MSHTRTAGLLAALAFGAFLMAGCSSGGGEPSVDASVHELLQQEYDAALVDLRAERDAKAREAAAREGAESEAARLRGELTTANGRVTELQMQIGVATDTADASTAASLYAQLNAAKASVTALTGELTTANARVTTLETLVGDATNPTADSLRGQIAKLTTDLATAEARVTALTSQLGTAQEELEEAQEDVVEAQQQAQQQVSSLEANQRADSLLRALEGNYGAGELPTAFPADLKRANTPVIILPPRTGTSAVRVIKDGGYTVSSFSAPSGHTGKKFTRTGVGEETLVVITDLEPKRRVLDHHFVQREGTDATSRRSATRLVTAAGGVPFGASLTDITAETSQIKISHGFSTSYDPPADNPNTDHDEAAGQAPKMPTTISGQVYPVTSQAGTTTYRVSGRFECGGSPGCKVTLTPSYDTADANGNLLLTGVALSVTAGTLYFRPTTAEIALDGSLGTGIVDAQYMAFGYWLTEPSTPTGSYRYEVFGNAVNGAATPTTLSVGASFSGTAVGVYVEQGGTGADLSKRQGQFTASVNLSVKTGTDLSGEIGNFKTTAMGGSSAPTTSDHWLVDLAGVGADAVGTATIKNLAGASASVGAWEYDLVANHANADPNDNPSAAVGVFDTRIPGSLHLSGAFGAKRD